MSCACSKSAESSHETNPTTQCIACAQKHADEAWECFHEYNYANENRRHIRGALRAVVLHTYREWPDIAARARHVSLLVQEARDTEAEEEFTILCNKIDSVFLELNPEVAERLKALKDSAERRDSSGA